MRQERVSWTVEGETLELETLETQPQIKRITIERLIDKCIVPKDKYKRNVDSNQRINKLRKIINKVRPIIVLEDSKGEIVRILDGSHRVRLYEDMGRREIQGKIVQERSLTEKGRRVLMYDREKKRPEVEESTMRMEERVCGRNRGGERVTEK